MKRRYTRELLTRIASHAETDSNDYTLPYGWAIAAAWVQGNVEMKVEILGWPKLPPRPLARPTELYEAGFVLVAEVTAPPEAHAPPTPAAHQGALFHADG